MDNNNYRVKLTFTEDLLASSPANPEVYTEFIASKKPASEDAQDEVETLLANQKAEEAGWSVFHGDDQGLFLFDYHVKGFLKEAASAITGKVLTAYKSKIDRFVFIFPRRLYLRQSNGEIIKKAPHQIERPVRAMTARGPRTTVKRSDAVPAGTYLEFSLQVLPLGAKEITPEILASWLDYGQLMGMGEWRSASYGRFAAIMEMRSA